MKKNIIIDYPNMVLLIINIISVFLVTYFLRKDAFNNKLYVTIVYAALSWLPTVALLLFKTPIPAKIILYYYYYLTLTLFFGAILNFNRYIPWFPAFCHFLAGGLLVLLGIFIFMRLDNVGFAGFSLLATYALFFSGFWGALWAIFLFIVNRPLNGDIIVNIIMNTAGAALQIFLLIIDRKALDGKGFYKLYRYFQKQR